jgi:ribonuclease P protein component
MPKFSKHERLCSKALIDDLFKKGQSFSIYPFRALWMPAILDTAYPAQILISVPRKNFRHAVIRNLLRRRIKEIYRRNKADFYQNLGQLNMKCIIALIYTGREVMASSVLEPKIIVILQRLFQENVKAVR